MSKTITQQRDLITAAKEFSEALNLIRGKSDIDGFSELANRILEVGTVESIDLITKSILARRSLYEK